MEVLGSEMGKVSEADDRPGEVLDPIHENSLDKEQARSHSAEKTATFHFRREDFNRLRICNSEEEVVLDFHEGGDVLMHSLHPLLYPSTIKNTRKGRRRSEGLE